MSDALLQNLDDIKNSVKINVGPRQFLFFESLEFVRTMDTGADALTFKYPYFPDPVDQFLKPFSYPSAKIFIGASPLPVSEMIAYNITNHSESSGSTREIACFSKTADIIDSTVQLPYEANNITLYDRCVQQCAPFGIAVVVDPLVAADIASPFLRVDAEATDKIFDHLSKLAAQKSVLLSCTATGDLYITKANATQLPVGTIVENITPETPVFEMFFNGRERFQRYDLINSGAGSLTPQLRMFAVDPNVDRYRNISYKADDNIPGENLNAAVWRRNKSAADSLSIDFPVNGWYAPNGTLWAPNTLVTVISPTMELTTGFTFLITRVSLKQDAGGNTGTLTLRPPQLYTKEPVVLEPWI